jgi:hypothetical protein
MERPFEDIEKTSLGSVFLDQPDISEKQENTGVKNLRTVDEIIENLKWQAKHGIDHAIFNMREPLASQEPLQIFKDEIIPIAADL